MTDAQDRPSTAHQNRDLSCATCTASLSSGPRSLFAARFSQRHARTRLRVKSDLSERQAATAVTAWLLAGLLNTCADAPMIVSHGHRSCFEKSALTLPSLRWTSKPAAMAESNKRREAERYIGHKSQGVPQPRSSLWLPRALPHRL